VCELAAAAVVVSTDGLSVHGRDATWVVEPVPPWRERVSYLGVIVRSSQESVGLVSSWFLIQELPNVLFLPAQEN